MNSKTTGVDRPVVGFGQLVLEVQGRATNNMRNK